MSNKPASHNPTPGEVTDSFRIFADAAAVLIWMSTLDKGGVYFNKSWLDFTGRKLEQELGKGWAESIHPEDAADCYSEYESAFDQRRTFSLQYRLRRHDGQYRWMLDQGAPVYDADRMFLGYVGSCTDIHELKAAEESRLNLQKQLFQSQKMESLGQLSTRVAHDLNNVLSVVRGHLQIMDRVRTLPDKFSHSMDLALSGCEQGAQLIQDLLRFGSPASCTPVNFSARALVETAVEFVRSVLDKKIILEIAGGGENDRVKVDENQLMQVFTNLLINAQHAMPHGGSVTITFHRRNIASAIADGPKPGRYVEIALQDTGTGIASEHLPRIFEPFFTTKPAGVGTGLGLSVAYSIVKNHGGWIEAASVPAGGARISVVLPVV